MKKRKFYAVSMAVILILSLFIQGCGKKASEVSDKSLQQTEQDERGDEMESLPDNTEELKDENTETDATEPESEADEKKPKPSKTPKPDEQDTAAEDNQEEQETKPEKPAAFPRTAYPSTAGALQVNGTQLTDENGAAVQLKGISTHGLAWFPDYVNEDCFKQFREEWNVNVIRLAMYTIEYGGYCSGGDQKALKELIHNGVSYATSLDMYVIIDWHVLTDQDPNTYKDSAKQFFAEMAEKYAGYNNVLYEICNEPNGGTSWKDIKSYAEEVIAVIRSYDEDGIIIVGTPNWSQFVDQAAVDPITGYDNIMYSLHFYAATHKESLRNTMTAAIDAGLPIFVSEYGICDASGNGGIDEKQANQWVSTMNSYGVSYVAWSLSNKAETASILNSSCNKVSGFTESDLSASGKWLYKMLTGENADIASIGQNSGGSANGQGNNGNSSAGQGNNGQGGSTGTGSPAASVTLTNGDITYTAELKNSWESDGKAFYQYELTLQNTSSVSCDKWEIDVPFSEAVTLVDGWNGDYSTADKVLHITSKDYNGSIAAGSSVKDIGFIVSGSKDMKVSE
ncbi:MAG: cellulase family glycosylhydrolase [Lachnospiraceae bacterium]|nr:cellulase family glycosylhydrolase [Lachnospiraceae bacterium]